MIRSIAVLTALGLACGGSPTAASPAVASPAAKAAASSVPVSSAPASSAPASLAPASSAPGPEGLWLGTLDVGAMKLRLAFHIERAPDGSLHATIDSLDQSARGLPVQTASYADGTVRLELARPPARFEGKLDGDKLVGTWTQGRSWPLTLSRIEHLEPRHRPQDPTRPFPYREQEVAISVREAPLDPARTDRITLGGTLTLPPGDGPFPAVVFITGSGPQDRDETVFDHKPFLVLSDALTRRGIATLRVDDRGVGASGGGRKDLTTYDFVEDVAGELAWLAARPEIDPRAIGVIGHSEGGLIGPMVAAKTDRARFVVMLAGPGMVGAPLVVAQRVLVERATGVPEPQIQRDRLDLEKLLGKLRTTASDADLDAATRAYLAADPGHQAERETIATTFRAPWSRAFLALDPVPYLEKVRVPVLAIAGENDLQVPRDNIPLIAAALRRAKNPDATAKLLPGLNHLFQHSRTGSPTEYSAIEETFAPEAIQLVGDWIVERAGRMRRGPAPPQ